jgi:hypothetical protein
MRLLLLTAAFLFAGCAAPCTQYCNENADYIEFCLENGSQDDWVAAANAGGFAVWGYSSKDEYVTGCKEDFSAQLGGDDSDVIEAECTDAASQVEQWNARSLCAELP